MKRAWWEGPVGFLGFILVMIVFMFPHKTIWPLGKITGVTPIMYKIGVFQEGAGVGNFLSFGVVFFIILGIVFLLSIIGLATIILVGLYGPQPKKRDPKA